MTAKVQAAFVKAQAELQNPVKTARANYGKYARLPDILDQVRDVFPRHGLALIQEPVHVEGGVGITVHILHESGEALHYGPLVLPPTKNEAQAFGSAVTYGCRYSLCAVLGIAGDEDDDGQQASKAAGAGEASSQRSGPPAPAPTSAPTTDAREKTSESEGKGSPAVKAGADTSDGGGSGTTGVSAPSPSDAHPDLVEADVETLWRLASEAFGGRGVDAIAAYVKSNIDKKNVRGPSDVQGWHLIKMIETLRGAAA